MKIYILLLLSLSFNHLFSQKNEQNIDADQVTFSVHIDSCIIPNRINKLCFIVKNYSDEDFYIEPNNLTFYSELVDSQGGNVSRKSIIEGVYWEPEFILVKSNDSIVYCHTTYFFEQFNLICNEKYQFIPTYYNSKRYVKFRRKQFKGSKILFGRWDIEPLTFTICNCY
jgi:hypothetical protein